MHFSSTVAIDVTQNVLNELNSRHGFTEWWKSVDDEYQGNIIFTLERIIDQTIEKHTAAR